MATITTRVQGTSPKGSPLTNVEVDNNFINLNGDKIELTDLSVTAASASGGGSLAYANSTGVFTFTPPDLTSYLTDLSGSDTDDLSEGATNLYFTSERVDDRVNALLQAGSGISLTYDDANNELTIDSDHIEYDATNNTGSTISKGTPVYQTGASGNTITIAPADANGSGTMPAIGLASEDITNGSTGKVTFLGIVSGFDTSSFSAGDTLFISETAGALTATRPVASGSSVQNFARVISSHASNGSVVVMGAGRSNDTPNLANNYVFIGNGTDAYEKRQLTSDDLSDVSSIAMLDEAETFTAKPTFSAGIDVTGNVAVTGTVDGRDVAADGTKLDGVESGATADQTQSDINALAITQVGTIASGTWQGTAIASAYLDSDTAHLSGAQTFTGVKTFASPVINTGVSGTAILDEDNMVSNSATKLATQQSIKSYVDTEVAAVVDSAPAALDTLNELAAALGDDANFSTTTSTALGNRLRVDTAAQGLNGTQQANAITNLGITATKAELNYSDGVTSNIQTQLDGKQATGSYLTANQTITLSGDVSGSGTTSIAVTIADDSHNHVISNVDGLQTALDAKLASSSYTAADVLTKIKTVDGAGSGLDADTLDGQQGTYYYPASNPNGYTTNVGDITGVTAGVGLSGGGTSGTVTLTVDLSELTDMTAAMVGTDEFIVLDASADRRKAANEIGLSIFNNDAGFTTNVGDITGVTAGSYITGGGTSGTVTINVDATSANTASKVVARDASGNFSAGTITASLSGNATTATTATNQSGGTVSATTGSFSTSATIDGHVLQDSSDRSGLLEISSDLGTWNGFQIKPTSTSLWSIMGDQDDFGFYDDFNNEWILQYNENSSLQLYHNGSLKLSTASTGVSVSGSISVTGTVDGRDIAADGALIDSAVQNLSDLSITATAAEINKLDGVTATTAELNYIDGVTSNIQTQLNAKATTGKAIAMAMIFGG